MEATRTRRTWREVKRQQADSLERGAGYEQARAAYELGIKVRQLREGHGMTQKQLALSAGMTQSTIARLEHGVVEPRFGTLERISAVFGQDVVVDFRPRVAAAAVTV
jgi:DNA-binding XRE family transcriptional regulator